MEYKKEVERSNNSSQVNTKSSKARGLGILKGDLITSLHKGDNSWQMPRDHHQQGRMSMIWQENRSTLEPAPRESLTKMTSLRRLSNSSRGEQLDTHRSNTSTTNTAKSTARSGGSSSDRGSSRSSR